MIRQEPKELPLVSIVVITYNSAKYVLETLDSAYNQSYKGPLELIISDDCSSDETVELCKSWLSSFGKRFSRFELLVADENVGISRNINRGCRAASGIWIKPIAGDDVLMSDCIQNIIDCTTINPHIQCLASNVIPFFDENKPGMNDGALWMDMPKNNAVDLKYLFENPFFVFPGPGYAYSKKLLEEIGYFPTLFRNVEDAPMLRHVVAHGVNVYVMKEATVFYRRHRDSITIAHPLALHDIWERSYNLLMKPYGNIWIRIHAEMLLLFDGWRCLARAKGYLFMDFILYHIGKILQKCYRCIFYRYYRVKISGDE